MSGLVFLRRLLPLTLFIVPFLVAAAARPQPPRAPTPDEVALRELVYRYLAASREKDLDIYMSLWSGRDPNRPRLRQHLARVFADPERWEHGAIAIRRVDVAGERAKVRFSLEERLVNPKTGRGSGAFEKRTWALDCVREEAGWRVARQYLAAEDLAAALLAAKSEAERQALLAAEPELVTLELAESLRLLGGQALDAADYPRSRAAYEQMRAVAVRLKHRLAAGIALGSLGNTWMDQGDAETALGLYRKARDEFAAAGVSSGVDKSLNNMAGAHLALGNYRMAERLLLESLKMKAAAKDERGMTLTLVALGEVHHRKGDYASALYQYRRSELVGRRLGLRAELAEALTDIGDLYEELGSLDLAMQLYEEAQRLLDPATERRRLARLLLLMGEVRRRQGDYPAALRQFDESLKLCEPAGIRDLTAANWTSMGIVHSLEGNYGLAQTFLEKALAARHALREQAGVAVTLNNLAEVRFRAGELQQALTLSDQATSLARSLGDLQTLRRSRTRAGMVYRALARPAQARQAFAVAIAALERLRATIAGPEAQRQQFLETKLDAYHGMIELLVAGREYETALRYAERARARVLVEILAQGRVDIAGPMTARERERERRLAQRLGSLNTQVFRAGQQPGTPPAFLAELRARQARARREFEAFQAALYADHPELRVQRGEAKPVTAAERAALLPDARHALLEYVVLPEISYLFVITRARRAPRREASPGRSAVPATDLAVYPLAVGQKDLAREVAGYWQALAENRPGSGGAAARLYDLLLKPAAARLRGKTLLGIVPDGPLWQLPFQALQPAPGEYLADRCASFFAPSLAALREMRRLRQRRAAAVGAGRRLLAFGDPSLLPLPPANRGPATEAPSATAADEGPMAERTRIVLRDAKLERLPDAAAEVRAIERFYRADRRRSYVGDDAGEARMRLEGPRCDVFHFAGHGVLDDSSPFYSYLVFSQAGASGAEDGLVEAWEIMRQRWRADIAILSACETARGRFGAGEGLIGTSWAFFVAGCPRLVVSQWKVQSPATRELMVAMHRHMRDGMGKAAALRHAALELRRGGKYGPPFYWAPFIVIGDGE